MLFSGVKQRGHLRRDVGRENKEVALIRMLQQKARKEVAQV